MYCLNGSTGTDEESTTDPVNPLFNLTKDDWWFHHINNCDQFPPAPGDFLELPANGQFTVELAVNKAFTTFSSNGRFAGRFTNGQEQPFARVGDPQPDGSPPCIVDPNIHTQNQSMAAGTAFAISYQSDLSKVTAENLVIFTVLYNTPWERIATYDVPNLPACPDDGCICAWGWVPNGCGEPNMYMAGYRCKVTGKTGDAAVAPGIPASWCEDDPSSCTSGARQMIYWHQLEGNNIETDGLDLSGQPRSPAYNAKLGFKNGAQTDIFLRAGTATSPASPTTTRKSDGISVRPLSRTSLRILLSALLCSAGFCFL